MDTTMTEDEIKELKEKIAKAGGSKYANSFTVIESPYDMTIVFKKHEDPIDCVTLSYKACLTLIDMMQEVLDSAKAKEEVSAENVPHNPPHEGMGTTLAEDLAENQDLKPFKCGVRWVPRPGIPQRD